MSKKEKFMPVKGQAQGLKYHLTDYEGTLQCSLELYENTIEAGKSRVDLNDVNETEATLVRHLVILIDQNTFSKSSYRAVLNFNRKLLTLEEYRDPNTRVSIILLGAHTTHVYANRVSVSDFPSEDYLMDTLKEAKFECTNHNEHSLIAVLRSLHLEKKSDELCVVCLHVSDSSVDHLKPQERDWLVGFIRGQARDSFALNALHHSENLPSSLLCEMVRLSGGTVLRAQGLKLVYDTLFSSIEMQEDRSKTRRLQDLGERDGWVLVNRCTQRVKSGSRENLISGVSLSDDHIIYSIKEFQDQPQSTRLLCMDQIPTMSRGEPINDQNGSPRVVEEERQSVRMKHWLAISYYYLTVRRRLNLAKYALWKSGHQVMYKAYVRSVTDDEILDWRAALEDQLTRDSFSLLKCGRETDHQKSLNLQSGHHRKTPKFTMMGLLELLKKYSEHVTLSYDDLTKRYKSIGLAKVALQRDQYDDPRKLSTTYSAVQRGKRITIHDVKLNRQRANLIMTTRESVQLIDHKGELISEVEGVIGYQESIEIPP